MKHDKPWAPLNGLLEHLPAAVCARVQPHLRVVDLAPGQVLYESELTQTSMYFPRSGYVSLSQSLKNGATSEIAMVGNEGMVGAALLIDGYTAPNRAVVQIAGTAIAINAKPLRNEFGLGSELQVVVLRYTQALLSQMAQSVVCNQHHAVPQRLSRWLLQVHDRVDTADIRMTQEEIAALLGVRREAITVAARHLQDAGLIEYRRGLIRIVDRAALLGRSCECYDAVRREYDRLF